MRIITAGLALALSTTAFAGYEAKSHKEDSSYPKGHFKAASAIDSKLDTCWQSEPEEENVGQWFYIDTPTGEITGLEAVVGWDKSEDKFKDYARLKTAVVTLYDLADGEKQVAETTVNFEDKRGWQKVELPTTKLGGEYEGGRVKITVKEVYPGKDYPNLAVSELRVHMKEFEAGTLAIATPPDSEEENNNGANLIDGNARTFWAATSQEATFGLQANGYGLASLGLQPGPASYARPKKIEITANDAVVTHEVANNDKLQWFILPTVMGYTGGSWGEVKVKILEVYPGSDAAKGVAIAEAKLNAGSIEDL